MKKQIILFFVLLLTSINVEARKYIINAGRVTPLPVRVVVYGETYYITERNQYSNNQESGACLIFEGGDNFTFFAYAPDDTPLDTQQYTWNNKTDSRGNIEYTRIVLGGVGVVSNHNNSTSSDEVLEEVVPDNFSAIPSTSTGKNTYANSGGTASSYQEHIASNVRGTVEDVSTKFGNMAQKLIDYDTEGYPNIMIKLGWSTLWGEYARVKTCIGGMGGFILYGGIGKNLLAKDNDDPYSWEDLSYKKRMTWHAGLGYYISPDEDGMSDISMGITFGKTCKYDQSVLTGDLTYSYFFGNKTIFGVHGGAGAGLVMDFDSEELKFAWNLELGIAIKLWQE